MTGYLSPNVVFWFWGNTHPQLENQEITLDGRFFYSPKEKTMTDCNNLTLDDLIDDNIPSKAVICWRCGGWGIISVWFGQYSNVVRTSSDCDICEGKGWQLPIPTTSQ